MQYKGLRYILSKYMVLRVNVKAFLTSNHTIFVICTSIKIAAYYRPNKISHKNSNSKYFLTNTISTTAQSTAVFSTIAHLLFHNRCQFSSHFLMVIEQFTLFTAQCCLNNWFKVLSTCVTSLQSLVSQLIGTNEQSIKCSYGFFLSQ